MTANEEEGGGAKMRETKRGGTAVVAVAAGGEIGTSSSAVGSRLHHCNRQKAKRNEWIAKSAIDR